MSNLVLYRSKDQTLPDFSKETGPGGEVFFDVRTSLTFSPHASCSLFSGLQPNLLSKDGTAALATAAFSRGSGEYYAYGISLSVSGPLWLPSRL
jgi:prolyl oligopeptidase